MLVARWFAGDAGRNEYDEKTRACVGDGEFFLAHVDQIDAKFFMQLSTRRVGVRFSGLALAARKLPQTTVPLFERALAYEKFISARDDRCDDANDRIRHYA
jgi:hypothetical protein